MLEVAGNSFKVLVIEDDTLTRMTICSTLRKNNFTTVEACTGLVGLQQYQREHPDMVITDLMMPDKGGLETIIAIRALNPNVKIVAMTGGIGDNQANYLDLAAEVGAARCLQKPFTPEQLLHALKDMQEK